MHAPSTTPTDTAAQASVRGCDEMTRLSRSRVKQSWSAT